MSLKRDDQDIIAEDPGADTWGIGGGWGGSISNILNIPRSIQDSIKISMGSGRSWIPTMVEPSQVVPPLGEPITLEPEGIILEETDRRDPVPIQAELPVAGIIGAIYTPGSYDPDAWMQSPYYKPELGITKAGVEYMHRQDALEPIVADEETDVSLLGDIYDVVDASLGGVLPGGVPMQVPTAWGGPVGPIYQQAPSSLPVPQAQGGMAPPGLPPATAGTCSPDDPYKGWVYKRVCGQWKWVKKKYRRRKQLFTTRDASQLSSLIGIAGKSQIAKTWIASHPS